MIVALDVDYGEAVTRAALVGFEDWDAATTSLELVTEDAAAPAAYQPGAFFARELPYLLPLLARVTTPIATIIVDGYVWLGPDRPGLGARLHAALTALAAAPAPPPAIVGVAKTRFASAPGIAITRGTSASPLYVTAHGLDPAAAAAHVTAMHGPYRIPTLLKRVDSLARGHVRPSP